MASSVKGSKPVSASDKKMSQRHLRERVAVAKTVLNMEAKHHKEHQAMAKKLSKGASRGK